MSTSWIDLPASWRLEDVQEVLNVIISVLSVLGMFVFSRLCWVGAAARLARNQSVKISSITSVNTIGEAFDVLLLLKSRILSSRHLQILAQCIVIALFSATGILSGPIARYSTRPSHRISQVQVQSSLASVEHDSIGYANVEWNRIQSSLDVAGFPYDQLLDVLPDTSTPWIYDKSEWNSTWSMNCQSTPFTPITLYDTGNCTLPKSQHAEIPGLAAVMPGDYDYYYQWWDGYYVNSTTYKDVLMFIIGETFSDFDNNTNITYAMSVSLASVHLHGLVKGNDSSDCDFGAGPIGKASYTRIECDLVRLHHIPDQNYVAYPNCGDIFAIPEAYESNFQARFKHESVSDSPITIITPQDLIRFYQVYHISKDTQSRKPVTRKLSVRLPDVQLSTAFLTVALLIALFIAAGLARCGFFLLRYQKSAVPMPVGKLDWMLQSIKDEGASSIPASDTFKRSVVLVGNQNRHGLSEQQRKRVEFEAAEYGAPGQAST
jgi:hypothetical protein